jgi:hypothetical protein
VWTTSFAEVKRQTRLPEDIARAWQETREEWKHRRTRVESFWRNPGQAVKALYERLWSHAYDRDIAVVGDFEVNGVRTNIGTLTAGRGVVKLIGANFMARLMRAQARAVADELECSALPPPREAIDELRNPPIGRNLPVGSYEPNRVRRLARFLHPRQEFARLRGALERTARAGVLPT